jgi:hypothetical protein
MQALNMTVSAGAIWQASNLIIYPERPSEPADEERLVPFKALDTSNVVNGERAKQFSESQPNGGERAAVLGSWTTLAK